MVKDEAIKKELDKLVERYRDNELTQDDKAQLEEAKGIVRHIADQKGMKLDHTLTESEMEKILDGYLDHVYRRQPLASITDITELIKAVQPFVPYIMLYVLIYYGGNIDDIVEMIPTATLASLFIKVLNTKK